MFNNLIESSSHASEFKRRGSFFLFTVATYFLLFVIAGIASIYAYDARLEDQNTEIVTMLNPAELPGPPVPHNATPPRGNNNRPTEVIRQTPMLSVNHPNLVPETTDFKPNTNLPIPGPGIPYKIGDHDSGLSGPVGSGPSINSGGNGNDSGGPLRVEVDTPPPPQPPIVKPVPRIVSKGPITGLALSLPKPLYPEIAKRAGANGPVNVQVLIDETGKVVSAKAVSGNPLLRAVAQQAALGARFSPTRLGDQPVKVSGVITYNFLLQ